MLEPMRAALAVRPALAFRAVLAVALLAASACGPGRTAKPCGANGDCGTGGLCDHGVCAASAAPQARVDAAEQSYWTGQLLRFDASGSTDPDANDAITAYRWSVAAVGNGACDADVRATAGPALEVVFLCPGQYEVRLVVVDSAGVESAPDVRSVVITLDPTAPPPPPPPPPGAPAVAAGPRIDVAHRCAGAPLACRITDESGAAVTARLSAAASSADGSPVALAWACEAPAGARDATIELSDATAPAPLFSASTHGTAIAGDYRCTVTATDVRGLAAHAVQTVRVGNRPPLVSAPPLAALPHRYDPAQARLVATGTTPPLAAVDPDGDPLLAPSFAFRVVDGGKATASVTSTGFTGEISLTAPLADAAVFLGAARSIAATIADVNGATSAPAIWPVAVLNTPPRIALTGTTAVDHAYDWAAGRYVAAAVLATIQDDDGDPLDLGTTSATCGAIERAPGGAATVTCAVPYAGIAALRALARRHDFDLWARDPWTSTTAPASLTVGNRAPALPALAIAIAQRFRATPDCCWRTVDGCEDTWRENLGGSATIAPPPPVDPDGDPVELSVAVGPPGTLTTANPVACTPSSCGAFSLEVSPGPTWCPLRGEYDVSVSVTVDASDGVASQRASIVAR